MQLYQTKERLCMRRMSLYLLILHLMNDKLVRHFVMNSKGEETKMKPILSFEMVKSFIDKGAVLHNHD